jgi:uncharacterized protein
MQEQIKFDSKVEQEIGYYVYGLLDPRTNKLFYIGKGLGNRVFSHADEAASTVTETDKLNKIREITDSGNKVEYLILRHGMTEAESYLVESVLIDTLLHTGVKLTNAVLGHNTSLYGISTVEDINMKYSAEPLGHIQDGCILININKSYGAAKKNKTIYEATRGTWVIAPKMLDKLKYALAEYKGFIVEVFKINPDGWEKSGNRYQFAAEVAEEEIRNLYLNKRIQKKRGAANPIRYKL